jgi:hypothetical protein
VPAPPRSARPRPRRGAAAGPGAPAAPDAAALASLAAALLQPEAEETPERPTRALDALLDARFAADEIPALGLAAGGLDFFAILRELFRLGEADFVVRMAVLCELAESDRPRWEPDALLRHFAWLHPEVLAHLLRCLRRSGWLELDGRDHRLSERGEAVFPIVRRLLDVRPSQGDLALGVLNVQLSRELGSEAAPALRHLHHNLCRVVEEAELALGSHSEVRILETRARIERNLGWARRARVAVEGIDLSSAEAYRVAQQVGQQLSELHRWHAVLYRSLGDLADKRVSLGETGLSLVDLTQFLMRCEVDVLADFGETLVAQPVAPIFGIVDNLVLEAEDELVRAGPRDDGPRRLGWDDVGLQQAAPGAPDAPASTPLDRLVADLAGLQGDPGRLALAALVPAQGWAESAYRLSLLALAESEPDLLTTVGASDGDPALAALARAVPFHVEVAGLGGEAVAVQEPFAGAISRGDVVRLVATAASAPTVPATRPQ